MWEVIQPAEEGKLEVSFRWFRTCKDAEDFCLKTKDRKSLALKLFNTLNLGNSE